MIQKKNRVGKCLFFALLPIFLIGAFFSFGKAEAQEGSPIALRIAPLSYDLEIDPGEQKSGKIYIENMSDAKVEVQAEFSNFFIDDNGGYIFTDEEEIVNEKLKSYLMSDWLALNEKSFSLAKGENKVVNYDIRVPGNAILGGHYGVIFFRTVCKTPSDKTVVSSDRSSVCVSGRVGTLFLVQVGGDAVKKGSLRGVTLPLFTFRDRTDLNIELTNEGNSHFKPSGAVIISDLFGHEIDRIEIKDKTLLPTTSHVFKNLVRRKDFWGFYKLSGSIRDGNGQEMRFERRLFMIPWKEGIALLGVIIFWFWFLRKYRIFKKV